MTQTSNTQEHREVETQTRILGQVEAESKTTILERADHLRPGDRVVLHGATFGPDREVVSACTEECHGSLNYVQRAVIHIMGDSNSYKSVTRAEQPGRAWGRKFTTVTFADNSTLTFKAKDRVPIIGSEMVDGVVVYERQASSA